MYQRTYGGKASFSVHGLAPEVVERFQAGVQLAIDTLPERSLANQALERRLQEATRGRKRYAWVEYQIRSAVVLPHPRCAAVSNVEATP